MSFSETSDSAARESSSSEATTVSDFPASPPMVNEAAKKLREKLLLTYGIIFLLVLCCVFEIWFVYKTRSEINGAIYGVGNQITSNLNQKIGSLIWYRELSLWILSCVGVIGGLVTFRLLRQIHVITKRTIKQTSEETEKFTRENFELNEEIVFQKRDLEKVKKQILNLQKEKDTEIEELEGNLARFRFLSNAIPQIVWTAVADGTIDYCNKRFYEYTGYSEDKSPRWAWQRSIHPEDVERVNIAWKRAIRTGLPYELEYRTRRGEDNKYRWQLCRAVSVRDKGTGLVVKWFGTCTDIHEQKEMIVERTRVQSALENQLKEKTTAFEVTNSALQISESRFKGFMDKNPSLAWIKDDLGGYIYVNKAFEEHFKVNLDDILGKTDVDVLPKGVDSKQLRVNDRIVVTTGNTMLFEEKIPALDSSMHHWMCYKFLIEGETDGKKYIGGSAVDITERVNLEQQLRTSNQKSTEEGLISQSLMNLIPNNIYVYDIEKRNYIYVNKDTEAYLGISTKDILEMGDKFLPNIIHPEDIVIMTTHYKGFLKLEDGVTKEFVIRMRHRSGEYRWFVIRETIYKRSESGIPTQIIGVAQDVSEIKRNEEALRESERILQESQEGDRGGSGSPSELSQQQTNGVESKSAS